MIALQLEIFFLLALGYLLAHNNILSFAARSQITALVLNLVLPCAIIRSFELDLSADQLTMTAAVLLASAGIQLLYSLLSKVIWNRFPVNERINLQYGTMVSNAGFMGMPICEQLYGSMGLLLASIFLIPQRIVMWSAGLSLYTDTDRKTAFRKVVAHPCIIALEIGVSVMILRLFHINIPEPLNDTIGAVASCNTALSMLMIGGMMSDADKNDVLSVTTLLYSFVRLVVIPLVIWGILILLHLDRLVIQVCVVLSAMPAASTTGMLAQKYHRNPGFASKIIFVSTLFSMITLPLITTLIEF